MNYQELEIRRPNASTNSCSKPRRIVLQGNEYTETIPEILSARNSGIKLYTEKGSFYLTNGDLSTGTAAIGATGNGKTTISLNLLWANAFGLFKHFAVFCYLRIS